MESFEIYFNDLNKEAQQRYLDFEGVESADDLNHEICPLAIVDCENTED